MKWILGILFIISCISILIFFIGNISVLSRPMPGDVIKWGFWYDDNDNVLKVSYTDNTYNTNYVTITIQESEKNWATIWQTTQYSSNFIVSCDNVEKSHSYYVSLLVNHKWYGSLSYGSTYIGTLPTGIPPIPSV